MNPHYADPLVTLYAGDCLEVLAGMDAESVDSVVTDPPAGIAFMSKEWDDFRRSRNPNDVGRDSVHGRLSRTSPEYGRRERTAFVEWMTEIMRECYRVLKPGGYAVVWSIPRTCHWTGWAMEDAGFIIRDQLAHVFASGFPKGRAQLKPAREDWWLARKPGPLRPLAIDDCRIGTNGEVIAAPSASGAVVGGHQGQEGYDRPWKHDEEAVARRVERAAEAVEIANRLGRWPSNVLLSDPALFDEPNPDVVGSGAVTDSGDPHFLRRGGLGFGSTAQGEDVDGVLYGDSGGYSRFFIIPKSDRAERERGLADRTKGFAPTMNDGIGGREHDDPRSYRANVHPTVKPIDLMRHLVRLVTPTDGVVLDCFLGSGTTCLAASELGIRSIGIEQSAEYLEIAKGRLLATPMGLGLDTDLVQPVRKLDPRVVAGKGPSRPEGASASSWFTTGYRPDEEDVA